MKIDHDGLFKKLINYYFNDFIELFLPELSAYIEPGEIKIFGQELLKEEGDETQKKSKYVDILVEVKFKGKDTFFLVHIESQAQPQSDFNRRMFHYFAQLDKKYNRPIYPIALLSYDSPRTEADSSYEISFPDKKVLEYNYATVQLNCLSWKDFIQYKNPVAAALMIKMNIAPADRIKVKLECARLLATLNLDPEKMQFLYGFIDTYSALSSEQETEFRKELYAQIPGGQKMTEVLTKAEVKGFYKGGQNIIFRQLKRKFGSVENESETAISKLSTEQLEVLGEAILDFEKEEDLEQWLAKANVLLVS
ncbi:MAG: DUF4351 domain-containing protein [Cyanothece sp. SIO1E1]|nr:DUF4351 domain-containing protein [Cyanothece sp. SIO1E1]